MESIGERLNYCMTKKGLNPNKIAVSTKIHPTTIKNYLNNIGTPDNLKLDKVAETLDIDFNWLLTGEGESEREKKEENANQLNESASIYYRNDSIMHVPLVNQYAYGGYMTGFNDPVYIEELPKVPFIVEKEHKGEYICFEVKGDSMDDGTHESYLERDISEKAIDNCVDYLNTQNPEIANEFAKSGFISVYLKEKQKEFLGL